MSQADPANSLLGSRYECGHLPACGADPGLRDGSKFRHSAMSRRAGPRKSPDGYDQGSSKELEEARGTSSPDVAESGHV